MATEYQQRLCEFCLTKSDILEPHEHDAAGWTEVADEEGALDRCPDCTGSASLPRTGATTASSDAQTARDLTKETR